MLEDILALVAVLICVAFVVATIRYTIKFNKEQRERKEQAQRDADAYWESERIRRKERQQAKTLAAVAASNTPPPKASAPVRPSYAPSPTQEMQSYNSRSLLDDLADVAIIANTVRHWNDSSPSVSRSERSVGWESSSSSSSDSSYDSGPSFSDSGPSSDW